MKIGNFEIGRKTFIIAEIGNNHLGDAELAMKTLEAAAASGADAVKFQLFDPELLVSKDAPVLKHVPDKSHGTQRERFKSMVLPGGVFRELAQKAESIGMVFLCTPFDEKSADFLDDIVPAFKVASGDANNLPLLRHVISKGKPVLVSTGFCKQEEVDRLAEMLPKKGSILLHCIGAYPVPDNETGLSLIPFYNQRYGLPVGYSDHTADTLAPLAAVATGAVVIEKHFILDRSIPGGDRALSLEPKEMSDFIRDIRRLEKMMGDYPRKIQPSEEYGRTNLRRSAYAKYNIRKGQKITAADVIWLRPVPANSVSFEDFDTVSSFIAQKDIDSEEPLTYNNIDKAGS
ncbi:MAG: N-acetylneuraminate synthase family protein [Nitrospirae bacterium]|nr:N-acetylneuraminate synthase family protein [Nitrospirota bacterium]